MGAVIQKAQLRPHDVDDTSYGIIPANSYTDRDFKIIRSLMSDEQSRNRRVAAYTRVGTTSEKSYLENLSAIISDYSSRIQANQEWEYAGVYADDTMGLSGIRAEFERMMTDAREGKFDIILPESVSRFGQTTDIMLETVRELQSLGVSVHFEEQGIDTLSGDSEQVLELLSECAERELVSNSELLKSKRRAAFARGEGGFRQTYGYDIVVKCRIYL